MMLDPALRLTDILLALAILQQGAEHMAAPSCDRRLFMLRMAFSLWLLSGILTPFACAALFITSLLILKNFQGPYNGGSDRMGLLILMCLTFAHALPMQQGRELAFGYLAIQLTLSYFIAGWVKIISPDWRNGRALQDVFRFSAYPVSESLRNWASRPQLLCMASWSVMLFELLFPFSLLNHATLIAALIIAALFHVANACLFGLNRFLWTWLAAYPSLLWLQERLMG